MSEEIRREVVGGLLEMKRDDPEVIEMSDLVLRELRQGDDKEKILIEVIKAEVQVVSGTMTHLTLKISDGGEHRTCRASIWKQPWKNRTEIVKLTYVEEGTKEAAGN